MGQEYLKIGEFANALGVHPDTIRRMLERGEIKGDLRIGSRIVRIPLSELDRLKREYTQAN